MYYFIIYNLPKTKQFSSNFLRKVRSRFNISYIEILLNTYTHSFSYFNTQFDILKKKKSTKEANNEIFINIYNIIVYFDNIYCIDQTN